MEKNCESQDDKTGTLIGFGLLSATLLVFCLGVLLIWFAILRENQVFWTNAGGYPILLRDIVRWTYLPLLFLAAIILFTLSMACFSKVCGSIRFFALESVILLMCWGLLATSSFIAFKNNITNIFTENPVHHH